MVDEKTKSGTNGNQMQREIVNCPTTEMTHLIQLVQGFSGKTLSYLQCFQLSSPQKIKSKRFITCVRSGRIVVLKVFLQGCY